MESNEQKPQRTVDNVKQEYTQGCLRAGHLQYQIHTLQKDLELLNNSLRDMNLEAASLQAKKSEEDAKAAKAAAEAQQMPKLEGIEK